MASDIKWLVDNRVIVITYTGTIKTDDVIKVTKIGTEWLENNANQTIHLVNDLSQTDGMATDFQRVGDILTVTRTIMSMDNMGMMAAFGSDNRMIKFLLSIVSQIGSIDYRMFETYEQCKHYLEHNNQPLLLPPKLM